MRLSAAQPRFEQRANEIVAAVLLSAASMAVVEAVSESEDPLVVVLQTAAAAGVSALDEVVRPHVRRNIPGHETCRRGFRDGGCERLAPGEVHLPPLEGRGSILFAANASGIVGSAGAWTNGETSRARPEGTLAGAFLGFRTAAHVEG